MKTSPKNLLNEYRLAALLMLVFVAMTCASTASAIELVFSRNTPVPHLGITAYDGFSDVRLNDDFPNASAGAEAIFAGDSGNAAINRALVRWDLSSLAGGTVLGDATLRMNVTQVSQDIGFETVDIDDFFDFHRIVDNNAGWLENGQTGIGQGDATGLSPSWNNFSQTPLQPWVNGAGTGNFPGLGGPGDGYDSSPAFTLNQADYTTPLDVQITVPQAVIEDIIAGGANHPGFLLRARDEFFAGRILFSGDATLHTLTVDVDIPPAVAELEIDRTTGALSLMNNTGSAIDFKGYTITSVAGALDATEWTRVVDSDTWSDTSATTDELGEGENPFVNGIQLTSGGTPISLGDAWITSPTEDLQMELVLNDDSTQAVSVSFVGNGDAPFELGDLDFMNGVTEADWPIYKAGFGQDLSGMSQAQGYAFGDLNGDGVNDHTDFALFETAFDDANGIGAFAAMLAGVPEPGSAMLVMLGGFSLLMNTRRSGRNKRKGAINMKRSSAYLVLVLSTTVLFTTNPASAEIFDLIADADVRMVSGTTNSRDDNNGGQDNPLIGLNTAGIDNFTMYGFDLSGLTGLNVLEDATLTVIPNPLSNANHGTADDLIAARDLFPTNIGWIEGGRTITGADNMTDMGEPSFLNFAQYNDDPGPASGTSVPWKDAAGNDASNLLGALGAILDTEPGYAQGDTPEALTFNISQATAQGWVDNGLGGLVFSTIDNGDSRSRFQMGTTILTINAVDDQPTLEVNTTTGEVTILNDTVTPFEMNFYEINSPGGALAPGTWSSFQDQDLEGSGSPNNTGDGWEELGTPDGETIAEAYLQGSLTLGNGDSETLGNVFDNSVFGPNTDGDLQFNIGLTDDSLLPGKVVYVTSPGIAGDYNGNGVVDAADYTVWRDNLGGTSLPNEGGISPGIVDEADYAFWKSRFGASSGSGAINTSTVPEPGNLVLFFLCGAGLLGRRR